MRSSWLASAGTAALHAGVEGAWITVAYATIQAVALSHPLQLGVPHFVVAAGLGVVLARHGRARRPVAWLTVVAVVTLVGCAADPAAFAAVLALDPLLALATHGGGLLAGLAVIRGGRHGRPMDDEFVLANLLERGVPALAVPWLLASTVTPGPLRTAFDAAAFLGTVLFVGLGFAALGLARLRAMGIEAQPGGAGGVAWLAVIASVPLTVVIAAAPIAAWLRLSPDVLAQSVLQPVANILQTMVGLLSLPFAIVLEALTRLLRALGLQPGTSSSPGGQGGPAFPSEQDAPISMALFETVAGSVLLVLVAAVLVIVVIIWARGLVTSEDARATPVREERRILLPRLSLPRRERPRLPRRGPPHGRPSDAVSAYLATLDELENEADLARQPAETPAGHQRRLSRSGVDLAPLRWLAIDYQLARYAERRITPSEDARALRRWELMREAVRQRRSGRR